MENKTKEVAISSVTDLQQNYKQHANNYLTQRFADNPEFQ